MEPEKTSYKSNTEADAPPPGKPIPSYIDQARMYGEEFPHQPPAVSWECGFRAAAWRILDELEAESLSAERVAAALEEKGRIDLAEPWANRARVTHSNLWRIRRIIDLPASPAEMRRPL